MGLMENSTPPPPPTASFGGPTQNVCLLRAVTSVDYLFRNICVLIPAFNWCLEEGNNLSAPSWLDD